MSRGEHNLCYPEEEEEEKKQREKGSSRERQADPCDTATRAIAFLEKERTCLHMMIPPSVYTAKRSNKIRNERRI